ncbi:MAG: mannose-6-phosphate isomerase-like protein (cupin superfamily) [Parasphingorhabdus sp.]|jgi:mannose-6-phosphate isomerase-like protein (cupin superfamily)
MKTKAKNDDQIRLVNTDTAEYEPYDFAGPALAGISQLNLSYNRETGHGSYIVRMEPGTVTTSHVHTVREEYLVLEGDVVEAGGRLLGPGDYIIFEPGTEHCTRTINGCTIIGFDYPLPESAST